LVFILLKNEFVILCVFCSPSERSQSEHHVIYKLLKGIESLTSQLGLQELKQISTVTTVETWDRGQISEIHTQTVTYNHFLKNILAMIYIKYNRRTKEHQKEYHKRS